jgi:phosphoenolpyruvate carboxykinase (ATP)
MITSTSRRLVLNRAIRACGRTSVKALTARSYSVPTSTNQSSLAKKKFNDTTVKSKTDPLHQVKHKSTARIDYATSARDEYDVSETIVGDNACSDVGIDSLGITGPKTIYRNLTFQELFDHEVSNEEGDVASAEYGETFTVDTGKFTGRSPKDKWVVLNKGTDSADNLDWGEVNQPTSPEVFDELYDKAVNYFNSKEKAYVFDCFCGANPKSQKKVRFVHEMAWQQHFVTNMFIRPEKEDMDGFEPDFTVINACAEVDEDWERHGLNSEVAVVFNIEKKTAIIFGTWYGGENKKGIFSLMNYWLPMADPPQLPMHCSANVCPNGETTLFFGLSGTGKTTLSADPHRALIGDDEHGWDEDGIFNFEGGCYAKTINLSEETEPDIYRAIKTDAMLENVMLKPASDGKLEPDYFDVSKTQNGRVSYPIFHIDNYHKPQMAGHPNNIIFLTCDAFGVLPPVSKLEPGQAMYHFISGYTAKVAGTERGITEPTPNFSACFGAAFLTLHPTRYADLLAEKMEEHGSHAWLVNTGWSGGSYGVGERMSIKTTRSCIDSILDGTAAQSEFAKDDIFGFDVPLTLPGVDSHLLNPRNAWEDKDNFDKTAHKLAGMFEKNFEKFSGMGSTDYTKFGPKV